MWSAGCASGEEPYSMAILLSEVLEQEKQDWTIHIFATDIDEGALEEARAGVYGEDRLEDAKLGIVRKYFLRTGGSFEVLPEIRDMVMFSRDDLTSPSLGAPSESVFGSFDIVLCRNVLIYFNGDLQRVVCRKLADSLVCGGHLVLGEADGLAGEVSGAFEALDELSRVYRKRS